MLRISQRTLKTPQLVFLGFTDSPIGFAGWLWDLEYASSDAYPYRYEGIITDTMMTWIQPPSGSSCRMFGMNNC